MLPARRSSVCSPAEDKAPATSNHQELLSDFVRPPILHHAAKTPLVGFWIIEELARDGYRLSPGTRYPVLRRMKLRGHLCVGALHLEGRRMYPPHTATKEGRDALVQAKDKLRELFHELIEEEEVPPKARLRRTP